MRCASGVGTTRVTVGLAVVADIEGVIMSCTTRVTWGIEEATHVAKPVMARARTLREKLEY